MVSADRTSDFECHLQAERDMMQHCFPFDHVNYTRYMTYQHVSLRTMERDNHSATIQLET